MNPDLNATLIQRIEISPGLAIFRIVPDGETVPQYEPGQYLVLGLPGDAVRASFTDLEEQERDPAKIIKRAYSIASSPLDTEFVEFYVALVSSGALTPRLFALEPGDRVFMSAKAKGVFTLDEATQEKNILLVGTGTGLAPYMSMLRTTLQCGDQRRFAVLHGARHSSDLGYRAELQTLDRLCPNFTYIPSISRAKEEPVPWHGPVGHIQDVWQAGEVEKRWGFHPTPNDTHVFLCGNPSMIEGMITILGAEGYREHKKRDPGQIHVERYW